ncbi:macro domain-containing protein [Corallococcus macrosporus]|uniref:Appr-1-p processing domain-containing protein n=1 Tax=Myxococcus fulvus (strain ATCC BAA-855 / HW-1) TaxID=483219 RepID=F8CFH5_MYXFH|nr:macro domain-containing protein [Corallococcus macrosporus]AEI63585.1 appr-1-p processing domain-containing protein [Corallococcus macrosporus]
MPVSVVEGDLLVQPVEAIVNAWNRNIIPWWLLLPQGVSGAIKRRGGVAPFREVARAGPMALGSAVVTSAGRLPFKAIIHVAGIDMRWRASERSIQDSVRSALTRAREQGFRSVAFPVIGAGSGGFNEARALELMRQVLDVEAGALDVSVVRFRR